MGRPLLNRGARALWNRGTLPAPRAPRGGGRPCQKSRWMGGQDEGRPCLDDHSLTALFTTHPVANRQQRIRDQTALGAAEGRCGLAVRIPPMKVRSVDQCPPESTRNWLVHVEKAAAWSDLGEKWSRLHGSIWGIRTARSQRPSVAPKAGLVPDPLCSQPDWSLQRAVEEGSSTRGRLWPLLKIPLNDLRFVKR